MSEMTWYTVYDEDGMVVRSSPLLVREGAMGTIEVVYEELSALPVGQYIVKPVTIDLKIRAPKEEES